MGLYALVPSTFNVTSHELILLYGGGTVSLVQGVFCDQAAFFVVLLQVVDHLYYCCVTGTVHSRRSPSGIQLVIGLQVKGKANNRPAGHFITFLRAHIQ